MDCKQHQTHQGVLLNGRYQNISPLNHGSFGLVYLAKDHFSGNHVALKCLTKPSAIKDMDCPVAVDERSEELRVHSRIGKHHNIVNLLDTFETSSHTYLVLEYCSMGDLYEAIRQDKGPKETEHVRAFMLQLVDAISYLHKCGIYHRDIKPENIFLTETGTMKLGDFGLATTDIWSYESSVGSDRYMAPEVYDTNTAGLSPALADIWSIGICLLNILFSRNPFGVPAVSDPLFADYLRDRQSLFDVFPNMSQDTFEVLTHCLAIDPAKRSLTMVKDALQRVISFTTDDETLDEFCTENREVVPVDANRLPLRTPSITSPGNDRGEAFPWSRALQMTTPKTRQLSVIKDTETVSEDLFPESDLSGHDWYSKADTLSLESVVDSGLGLSIESNPKRPVTPRSKPVPIAGSMPNLGRRASSAIAAVFGKKAFESKSWTEMWEEEEEEQEERERRGDQRPAIHLKVSTLGQEDSEGSGRTTPRACLTEIKNVSSSSTKQTRAPSVRSVASQDGKVSPGTGFVFEEHKTPSPSSSSSSSSKPQSSSTKRSIMDKWAALGELRRGAVNTSPTKETPVTPDSTKRRFNTSNWRRGMRRNANRISPGRVDHTVWSQKQWSMSQDWRQSDKDLPSSPLRPSELQLDGAYDSDESDSSLDAQWIGGWKTLHQ